MSNYGSTIRIKPQQNNKNTAVLTLSDYKKIKESIAIGELTEEQEKKVRDVKYLFYSNNHSC